MMTYNEIQNLQSGLAEVIGGVDSAAGQLIAGEISAAVERLETARAAIDSVINEITEHRAVT